MQGISSNNNCGTVRQEIWNTSKIFGQGILTNIPISAQTISYPTSVPLSVVLAITRDFLLYRIFFATRHWMQEKSNWFGRGTPHGKTRFTSVQGKTPCIRMSYRN